MLHCGISWQTAAQSNESRLTHSSYFPTLLYLSLFLYLSLHPSLCSSPNRTGLSVRVEQALISAKATQTRCERAKGEANLHFQPTWKGSLRPGRWKGSSGDARAGAGRRGGQEGWAVTNSPPKLCCALGQFSMRSVKLWEDVNPRLKPVHQSAKNVLVM